LIKGSFVVKILKADPLGKQPTDTEAPPVKTDPIKKSPPIENKKIENHRIYMERCREKLLEFEFDQTHSDVFSFFLLKKKNKYDHLCLFYFDCIFNVERVRKKG
jgi:hypothetical protein